MQKRLVVLTVLAAIVAGFAARAETPPAARSDALYQLSTITALKQGMYEPFDTYDRVKERGDFGIGTFGGLDGEMIQLDGTVYQVPYDGQAVVAPDSAATPYATVTFFDADQSASLQQALDYEAFRNYLKSWLPTANILYAIRVDGTFARVKTRSVPGQSKPYPPLEKVLEYQSVFEFTNVAGTVVGFVFPEYMNGVQQPGCHFHFLTADRKAGGHLLEFTTADVKVAADLIHGFEMSLPTGGMFYQGE